MSHSSLFRQSGFSVVSVLVATVLISSVSTGVLYSMHFLKMGSSKIDNRRSDEYIIYRFANELRRNIDQYKINFIKNSDYKERVLAVGRLPYRISESDHVVEAQYCKQCIRSLGYYIEPSFVRGLFSVTIRVSNSRAQTHSDHEFVLGAL